MNEAGIALRVREIREYMTDKILHIEGYEGTLAEIGVLLETARQSVVRVANSAMVMTYWEIGRRIIELEKAKEE